MKKYFLIFILQLSFVFSSSSQNTFTIPDPILVNWFQAYFPDCITGDQLDTTCSNLNDLMFEANFDDWGLTDLTGIKYVNIINLSCRNNFLTFLPQLPSGINSLDCSSNQISDMSNLNLYLALSILTCSNNQLTSIGNLPDNLWSLNCADNLLTSLPNLPNNLNSLCCSENELTSLPILPSLLESLQCQNNYLTSLPTLPNTLMSIIANNNQLTTIPNFPQNLTFGSFSYNQLGTIPALNDSIEDLSVHHNLLTELPDLPSSLTLLNVSNNLLVNIPELPEDIYQLACDSNQITSLPVLPINIVMLFCAHNQISSISNFGTIMYALKCNDNQISCFPPFPINSLDSLGFNISNNPFTCLPNYISAMDGTNYLNVPLCQEDDMFNNPSGCNPAKGILGQVFRDENLNCTSESLEIGISGLQVKIYTGDSILRVTSTFSFGLYHFPVDSGEYTVSIDTINAPFSLSCASSFADSTVLLDSDQLLTGINFPMICKPGFDIGTQSVTTDGWIFPGQNHELKLIAGDMSQWYNMSCASGTSGEVQISVDGPINYQGLVAGALTPSSVNGNTFTYQILDFGTINAQTAFGLIVLTDTTAQAGDEICVTVDITPGVGDNNMSNNHFEYCYSVVNSYDPNMKEVSPVNVEPGYEDYFTYTIHFQNTGSAPAFNIRLVDTLDTNLDLETFQVINYSHYNTTMLTGNRGVFTFPNIMLPDSTSNPEGSKGFIQYRIKPKANLPVGTEIENTAYIYFDYNDPIVTNTTVNEFVLENSVAEKAVSDIKVFPNPFSSQTVIEFSERLENKSIRLYDIYGNEIQRFDSFSGEKLKFQKDDLKNGIYFLEIQGSHSNRSIKLIKFN